MSDGNGTTKNAVSEPAPADQAAAKAGDAPADAAEATKDKDETATAPASGDVADSGAAKSEEAATATASSSEDKAKESSDKLAEKTTETDKPAEKADVEMKDNDEKDATPAANAAAEAQTDKADEKASEEAADDASAAASAPAAATPATPAKASTKDRRKSTGAASTGKKLNKKGSRARITHIDAQPGDHYFVKLKGHPKWPVIICDDDMLPQQLLSTRPVTAKRPDGTYREDFADGGKRAGDRTFPVMYLYTNEFGWVHNTDLSQLDPESLGDVKKDKMRKDLAAAYDLAAENNSLDSYKELLAEFQEEQIEKLKAKEAKAAATPKKKKVQPEVDEDGDVDMDEPAAEPDFKKSNKKRKADESAETPARADSVKKPKIIKLSTNSTPKTANGTTSTPKSSKAAGDKSATKSKTKKAKEEKKAEKPASPVEPELSPEEKHARKEKEVLFLRHRLQKGLLTRDNEPKEEEMTLMSDYITKLEGFPDLEVSIIRATKINKVLKAILKLDQIPKEDEFHFKPRSQVLLDKWNKLLASDGDKPADPAANGVNGASKKTEKAAEKTNGVKGHKEGSEGAAKDKGNSDEASEEDKASKAEASEAVEAAA